jgi:O-antigen/teichoic acid export membrane protein
LALACVGMVSGLTGAALAPMVPRLAVERHSAGMAATVKAFLGAQRWLLGLLAVVLIVGLAMPDRLWSALVPGASLRAFDTVFPVLLVATAIRLSTALYSTALLAAQMQQKVIATPLLEGAVNLSVSMVLGSMLGCLGVALGTLAGAAVCLLGHSLHNIRRTTTAIDIRWFQLLLPWSGSTTNRQT